MREESDIQIQDEPHPDNSDYSDDEADNSLPSQKVPVAAIRKKVKKRRRATRRLGSVLSQKYKKIIDRYANAKLDRDAFSNRRKSIKLKKGSGDHSSLATLDPYYDGEDPSFVDVLDIEDHHLGLPEDNVHINTTNHFNFNITENENSKSLETLQIYIFVLVIVALVLVIFLLIYFIYRILNKKEKPMVPETKISIGVVAR